MSELRAFQLAYQVLGDLFANGVTAENLPVLGRIPELRAAFRSDDDEDTFAAAHYEALGLGVPPHESVFLDSDGVVGGAVSRAVLDTYARIGFGYDPTDVGPDHLTVQLNALTFACAKSVEAQRTLLDDHLLRWTPSLAFALKPYPLYAQAAELLVRVLLEHRATIDVSLSSFELLAPSIALDEDRTGIKDIAEYLCLAPASGLWLSRHDLTALGRGSGVPRGFGSRALMLGNLLTSAGDRDVLAEVLSGLLASVERWRAMFESLPAALGAAWLERLAQTTAVIEQMGQETKS